MLRKTVAIIILLSLVLLCGCTQTEKTPENDPNAPPDIKNMTKIETGEAERVGVGYFLFGGNMILSTKEELDSLVKEATSFDEAFFNDNVLFATCFQEKSFSTEHTLYGVYEDKNRVLVVLNRKFPEIDSDDRAFWIMLVPLKKKLAEKNIELLVENSILY